MNEETLCHRSACRQPGAIYFNLGNQEWYCPSCAHRINGEGERLCVIPDSRWKGFTFYPDSPKHKSIHLHDLSKNGATVATFKDSASIEFVEKSLKLFDEVSRIIANRDWKNLTDNPVLRDDFKMEMSLGELRRLKALVEDQR